MEQQELKASFLKNAGYFVKWTALSGMIGLVVGFIGAVFGRCLVWTGEFTGTHSWTLYLLPVAGLLIVWLYHICKEENNRGTNTVMEAIYSDQEITLATAPLIFVSTILTQFGCGSSGREGAALQLGGSLGNLLGKWFRLDEKDRKVMVMCGMSAAFAALFGTPLAAAIFSMEVVSIGVLYYAALIPCLFSSFLGAGTAKVLGMHGESFSMGTIPEFTFGGAVYIVFLGILCALVSCLFCIVLHQAGHIYQKCFPNPYIRIAAAGVLVILLTWICGSRDYNGSGIPLIERAMEGDVRYEAFLLKMLFTAVTLGAGFKGGEIVPTLCVGAVFGCAVGTLLGFSPSLSAGCGMAALFVGVTNCPISTLLISFELLGYEAMPYFALIIGVSFTLSGYYGLYSSQKFTYSKTKAEFINRKARS